MQNVDPKAEELLQYLENILQECDPLLIESPRRNEMRRFARRTMRALDKHHVTSVGYLSLVLIHYGVARLMFLGASEEAITFLRQLVIWQVDEVGRIEQIFEERSAGKPTTADQIH
jgi:hypothetical protein